MAKTTSSKTSFQIEWTLIGPFVCNQLQSSYYKFMDFCICVCKGRLAHVCMCMWRWFLFPFLSIKPISHYVWTKYCMRIVSVFIFPSIIEPKAGTFLSDTLIYSYGFLRAPILIVAVVSRIQPQKTFLRSLLFELVEIVCVCVFPSTN